MRLEQLKYVVEIYHTHSLSQAAKNLSLSQPSLSNALAALEEEWGVKLFHRLTTGVIPTEEGERLIPQITEALSELDRLYAVRSQPSADPPPGRTGDLQRTAAADYPGLSKTLSARVHLRTGDPSGISAGGIDRSAWLSGTQRL